MALVVYFEFHFTEFWSNFTKQSTSLQFFWAQTQLFRIHLAVPGENGSRTEVLGYPPYSKDTIGATGRPRWGPGHETFSSFCPS